LAEKCGLEPELYKEVCSELDKAFDEYMLRKVEKITPIEYKAIPENSFKYKSGHRRPYKFHR
jgi:hypothetical protein